MEVRRGKRRSRLWLVFVVVGALLIFGAVGAALYINRPMQVTPAEVAKPAAAKPVSVSTNSLFFGNAFWGRYMNDWSMASPLKTAYPFSRLNEFNRKDYDAWITGLECPTVANFS